MSLKQSIIVVNEYTVKSEAGKGSRGETPGAYVTRYMARELATEPLTPIKRQRTDDFILRYMARESATEAAVSRSDIKSRFKASQGAGGVAFGYGQVSLSDDELRSASADIQSWFDKGHTVLKTVLSFDQEYLRRHGIIPKDFVCTKKGDYRGHLDQMKLRMAVMQGLQRMESAFYDDLRYVGVIQVDTEHVHCHLAMVDAGRGTVTADGTQRGKINAPAKAMLRRAMDAWLDEKQTVRHMSSAVGYERRNVITFVKRWAHQQMLRESLPQFLIACLPEDRRLWRSSTNNPAMKKPNRIVRQLVEEVLARPESPLPQAMEPVYEYANHRREAEGLSTSQWRRLVTEGREKIIERGINGVYGLLRALPGDLLRVRTPMLDVMGMDYADAAALAAEESRQGTPDDLLGFSFRLRSYSTRLQHHRERRAVYHENARVWERADDAGVASVSSRVLYDFYLEEEGYHARCAAKYQKFLSFASPETGWQGRWEKVSEYGERLLSLESLRRDGSLRKMKDPDQAEQLGQDIYGQSGGHLLTIKGKAGTDVLDQRIAKMRRNYDARIAELRADLAAQGLKLELTSDPDGKAPDVGVISAGAEYDFEDVKGLDLHHMRYDFSSDVEVGTKARKQFIQWARSRRMHCDRAVAYLTASGQTDLIADMPVADIEAMNTLADRISGDSHAVLPSEVAALSRKRDALRRSRTVRLDTGLVKQMEQYVDRAASSRELDSDTGTAAPVAQEQSRTYSGLE
ncbi:relaxase MobL [Arthrobacter koreensis]|uniref:relaxase MobL n=1 Tax=Arthrobacter koreensis TaxID=199136 RepID=UPI003830A313